MEDEKTTNKHGKKKIHTSLGSITIGGEGGITGLLVFGGALAIAGFMAVTSFGSKQHKKKPIIHPHHQQLLLADDKHSLQNSTSQLEEDATSCLTSNECTKTISSFELLSEQPLILEGKINNEPSNTCFHHQEIAFSDHSHPESASSSNENAVAEESSGEEEKDEPREGLTTTETEDEPQDDITTTETENTDDDDDVTYTDEDTSKATETTSLDDKEGLIEQEFKKYYCESNVCSDLYANDGSRYVGNEDAVQKEAILNETANFTMLQKEQPSILTSWVMPMLMLGLLMLLVLLTRGLQESLNVLDDAIDGI
ncbi:transmembrane protein, putative [Medicago truncatula]|uniref:Transmembrane protein, putative n=2 Tax=Medicago truncatula TaxID=3880 RepID=A0A072U4Z0_MEDTR|nr:transmembrane protein, putative [Medicago truncatula]